MHSYINDWLAVIDGMNNENTYKLAWGRALIEICHGLEVDHQIVVIHFDQISEVFLKYYWNQTYFFKLYQGPSKTKPVIQQITEELIEYYQNHTGSTLPVWFDDAYAEISKNQKYYQSIIKRISRTLPQNVSHRFLKVGDIIYPLYVLEDQQKIVTFTKDQVLLLKEHAFVLSQLLNYRWAQLLEKFNTSPRITLKVKGLSEEKIRRNSLHKFKQALLKQFPNGIVRDFYTDEILDPNDISIDHVIPWSFMYSDDIWNLVITSKRRNSSKSNNTVSKESIDRLKQRNVELESILDPHLKESLIEAKEMKFVDRYWFEFRI
jgi:hypothetical protein